MGNPIATDDFATRVRIDIAKMVLLAHWRHAPDANSGHDPRAEGGLPAGWVIASSLEYHPSPTRTDLYFLVRPPEGGWVLGCYPKYAVQGAGLPTTTLISAEPTLGSLYARLAKANDQSEVPTVWQWLRGVLAGLYDPTDPAEVAAQLLFAMGGDFTVSPAADVYLQGAPSS